MIFDSHNSTFSDDQKRDACSILLTGCDRETAAKCLGCSMGDFHRTMSQDSKFAADVWRAEAASELQHVRNVQQAARDGKQWRASVWWLERRAPERYGRRDAGAITPRHMRQIIAHLVSLVLDEIHDASDLERVVSRLQHAAGSLQELCRDDGQPTDSPDHPKLLTSAELDEDPADDEDTSPCEDD